MEIQMSNPNSDNVSKQPTKPRKKNALAHGIYGKDILLPWESRKDFEKLLADLRDDFRPVGRMQNDIVFDLAHLRWQKYRVRRCTSPRLTEILSCPTWSKLAQSHGQKCAAT
jgi:hypothetical protein